MRFLTITALLVLLSACSALEIDSGTRVPLLIDVGASNNKHLSLDLATETTYTLRVTPWYSEPQFLLIASPSRQEVKVLRYASKIHQNIKRTSVGLIEQTVTVSTCSALKGPIEALSSAYDSPEPDRIPVEVDGVQYDLAGYSNGEYIEESAVYSSHPARLGWEEIIKALIVCGVQIQFKGGPA